jgi:hypothetical protein
VIFSLLAIKTLKKLSISISKISFPKNRTRKKALMQIKMHSYSTQATGFCLLGHKNFLVLKITFSKSQG